MKKSFIIFKNISFILVFLLLLTSCSLVDKLKEKFGTENNQDTKEINSKEETLELTSEDDLMFYNKYIDISNKIQEAGENIYKGYIENIPKPKSITKSSFISAVSMSISVNNLERLIKEYNRSYFDGGELSKMNASKEMKQDIEVNFKSLLKVLDEYYNTSKKVSDYYTNKEYEEDLSKAVTYDEEMKNIYKKYKDEFNKFTSALKKYKPQRKKRDIESISNPDEKSVAVLMNAYENTLDNAEDFYETFDALNYKDDLTNASNKIKKFEESFKNDKNAVLSIEYSDKTKYMKYSFEDYFSKMTQLFIDAANKFFKKAPEAKTEQEFNRLFDEVVRAYNLMISAYNTNINVINSFRIY